MPELRLFPLGDTMSDPQLKTLQRHLAEIGIKALPVSEEDDLDLEEPLSDDQLTDFMDRLEAHDAACDIYLPVEFEITFSVGDHTVGSTYALLDALEELRAELDIDEEGESEEEEELDMEVIAEQLRATWRLFLRGANTGVDRLLPLHVIS